MAAAPATMDLVSLRDNMCGTPFADATYLRVAADAETAMSATRKVAERLAGTGSGLALKLC
jgi:hypothetical protein